MIIGVSVVIDCLLNLSQERHLSELSTLKSSTDEQKVRRLYNQLSACKRQFQQVKMDTRRELLTLKSKGY